jgi:hypothetical protein
LKPTAVRKCAGITQVCSWPWASANASIALTPRRAIRSFTTDWTRTRPSPEAAYSGKIRAVISSTASSLTVPPPTGPVIAANSGGA